MISFESVENICGWPNMLGQTYIYVHGKLNYLVQIAVLNVVTKSAGYEQMCVIIGAKSTAAAKKKKKAHQI